MNFRKTNRNNFIVSNIWNMPYFYYIKMAQYL